MIRSILLSCFVFFTALQIQAQCSATISGGGEYCEGELIDVTFTMTGNAPWTVVYSSNGVPQPPLTIAGSPFTIALNAVENVTLELVSVEDGTGCNGTLNGSVVVVVHSAPIATNLTEECDQTSQNFIVSFEIIGGDPGTYQVTPPNGFLTGNVFTSDPIPSNSSYTFAVDDANGCGPAIVSGGHSCGCLTQAGVMELVPIEICGDGPITALYDDTNEFLDPNDILLFVLHTSSGNNLGTIIAVNTIPEFTFDPNTMMYGQTYYISAVVGNEIGNGDIDLTDFCLSVSQGAPVVFYEGNFQVACAGNTLTCSQPSVNLVVTIFGGTPLYTFQWIGPNGFMSTELAPLINIPGEYTVIVADANGCTGQCTAIVESDVDVPNCNVVVNPLSCANPTVELTPDCLNGEPPYSFIWSNGEITPSILVSAAGTYTVTISDISDCQVAVTITVPFTDEGCGHINGYVKDDENTDCMADPGEAPLTNWTIKASNGTNDYYDLSNGDGFYEIAVPPGNYTVEIINNLPDLWNACSPTANVTLVDEFDVKTADFPLEKLIDCPIMEVDISSSFLRRCFNNNLFINYCNNGTTPAEDATIELSLDLNFTINSASVPYTNPSPGLYILEIGDVGIGECGTVHINAYLSCDAMLGETVCSEAHIYPDTSCIEPDPLWSGASLGITSECTGGEVVFTISNFGTGDMAEPSYFIVIEDGVMLTTDPLEVFLASGASIQVSYPANGSTYILQLNQVSNHPGFSAPLQALEGCGINGVGSFSTGFVTQFPENDADLFISIDCHTVIGSFDPNDKYGYPAGYGEEHFIDLGQDLEYRIRFQNTGTDTAFKVVILDVLSPHLDITTLRPGASSHPYELSVLGSDTLVFTFDNILLPDSNINEALSHGFVKFRIDQSEENVLGDVIENEAAIYFDFNDPVITNKTIHKIGEHFVMTAIADVQHTHIQHFIQPNPTSGEATLSLTGQVPFGEMTVNLFTISGQLMQSEKLQAPQGKLQLGQLQTGLYFYEIKMQEGVIGRGRIVVE
ncbi:MAG: T9SS type A sorting domain-containing protein [Saprospiraceae bacterium]